jgi:LPS-assembly protein
MLKPGAWLVMPLLFLPLAAQVAQVLPDPGPPPAVDAIAPVPAPAVDTITPVPPPEIPFGAPDAIAPTMPKNLKIENFGGGPISGNVEEGVRFAGPGVKLSGDNGLEIFADRLLWNIKAQTVTLEGNVSVYQGNLMQRGERTVYYYEREFLDASGLRASIDPILLEAGKFTVEQEGGNQVYVGHDAGITTHDVENPNYWIRAKKTRIYPGDKIVFNDLRLYAGDTPVFWLPYLSQPLNADLGYHLVPGSRSNWGPFLLNTYGLMLGGETDPVTGENKDAWLLSRWHADLRATRGRDSAWISRIPVPRIRMRSAD